MDLTAEQPAPTPNGSGSVQDLVIADMRARKQVGLERYGTLLQPFNGRDALRDAYEESLDLATYLRQVIAERDHTAPDPTVVTPPLGRPLRQPTVAPWQPTAPAGEDVAHLSLEEWVGQALGAASTCWSDIDAAGVFQGQRCVAVYAGLMGHLNAVITAVAARTGTAPATAEQAMPVGPVNPLTGDLSMLTIPGYHRGPVEAKVVAPGLAIIAGTAIRTHGRPRYDLVHLDSGATVTSHRCGAHILDAATLATGLGIDWTLPAEAIADATRAADLWRHLAAKIGVCRPLLCAGDGDE